MSDSEREPEEIRRELFRLNQKIKENKWRFKFFLRCGIILLTIIIWSIINPGETGTLPAIYDLAFILLVFNAGYLYLLGYKLKLDVLKNKYLSTFLNGLLRIDSKQLSRYNVYSLERVLGTANDNEEWD